MMKPRLIQFTAGEVMALIELVMAEQRSGCYVGNRELYYKNLAALSSKLRQSMEVAQR